jgi:hypothetical protein
MTIALRIFSWIVAAYFGAGFLINVGFPPKRELLIGDVFFGGVFLFFLFLPFFNKIKIGTWLELERELEQTKKELVDFKQEVRNTIAVVATNMNTQKMSTQLNIYGTPDVAKLREAQKNVAAKFDSTDRSMVEKYETVTRAQQDGDIPLMLAKVRIDIERLLRKIVGARLSVSSPASDPIKLASTRQLFQRLVSENASYAYLRQPFEYVIRVCNAAIHAQDVSEEQADEALRLGAQIIEILSKDPDASDLEPVVA